MEGLDARDIIVAFTAIFVAGLGAWPLLARFYSDKRKEDAAGAVGFAKLLIDERKDWTQEIQTLRDELRQSRVETKEVRERLEFIEEDWERRGERLELVEAQLGAHQLHLGTVENMLREQGIDPPMRPPQLTEVAPHMVGVKPKRGNGKK
jgi:hypothetical protein